MESGNDSAIFDLVVSIVIYDIERNYQLLAFSYILN